MKILYVAVVLTSLLVACSGTKKPEVKGEPVQLEFLETYFPGEIASQWQQAIIVADAKRKELDEQDTNLRNIPLNEMKRLPGLSLLVIPIGDFALGSVADKDITTVDSILAMPEVKQLFPEDLKFMWSMNPDEITSTNSEPRHVLYAIKMPSSDRNALTGKHIKDATVGYDESSARVTIDLVMTEKGTDLWAQMTSDNVNRIIAMCIDGKVISAPRVMSAITGGSTQISGNFTVQEAEELASGIRAGR